MFSKTGFETHKHITIRNDASKGPPVMKIADTLQSRSSAVDGKVDDQGMKWMAPKTPITPIMVQNEGETSRSVLFSSGE